MVNKEKTALIVGGIDFNTVQLWANGMGIQIAALPLKYLGLPLYVNKISSKDCLPLLERVTNRIKVWHSRLFSFAMCVELAKSVLTAFSIYWLSSFVLPKGVLMKVNDITNKFLYEGPILERKMHMVSMARICRKKEFDLGMIDIKIWNVRAYCGLIYKVLTQENQYGQTGLDNIC